MVAQLFETNKLQKQTTNQLQDFNVLLPLGSVN